MITDFLEAVNVDEIKLSNKSWEQIKKICLDKGLVKKYGDTSLLINITVDDPDIIKDIESTVSEKLQTTSVGIQVSKNIDNSTEVYLNINSKPFNIKDTTINFGTVTRF